MKRGEKGRYIVDALLALPTGVLDVNSLNRYQLTLLDNAAYNNDTVAVRALLNADGRHKLLDIEGSLRHAFNGGCYDTFEILRLFIMNNRKETDIYFILSLLEKIPVAKDAPAGPIEQIKLKLTTSNRFKILDKILADNNRPRKIRLLNQILEDVVSSFVGTILKCNGLIYLNENGDPNADPLVKAYVVYNSIIAEEKTSIEPVIKEKLTSIIAATNKTITAEDLKPMMDRQLTLVDIRLIDSFLANNLHSPLDDNLVSTVLWKWINYKEIPDGSDIGTYLLLHKEQLKNVLLPIIEKLPRDQQAKITNQIFNAKDEKNKGHSLATLFWAGHTSLMRGRLLDVYNVHLAATNRSVMSDLQNLHGQSAISSLAGQFRNLFRATSAPVNKSNDNTAANSKRFDS